MQFDFLKAEVREQKMLSWASVGFFIFVSAFFWAPSRDALQVVYLFAFFLPMLFILPFRRLAFDQCGGWVVISALIYAGYSAFSSLWGEPRDFYFFVLQWSVLAVWLIGTCFLFSKYQFDMQKYLDGFVIFGVLIIMISIFHFYIFVYVKNVIDIRLLGWNVFRNANEIGAMCGAVALLAYVCALQAKSLRRTYIFYLFTTIAVVGLIVSFSRGALLAFLIMALTSLLIIRPPIRVWLPPFLFILLVLVVLLMFTHLVVGFQGRSADFGGRAIIWGDVFNRSQERLLTGIGMSKNTNIIISGVDTFNHAHNAWLDTFYRTGLIGIALFVFHIFVVARNFSLSSRVLPFYLWLGYGCISMFFDSRCFFWEIGAKWFLYWVPLGLIVAIFAQTKYKPVLTGK